MLLLEKEGITEGAKFLSDQEKRGSSLHEETSTLDRTVRLVQCSG